MVVVRVVLLIVAMIVVYMVWKNQISVAGGVVDGKLTPRPDRPNWVCSYQDCGDRYVEPLHAQDSSDWKRLEEVIRSMPRTRIVSADAHYLHATFKTPTLRFVDDVEFVFEPEQQLIHIRSASRVGYSDGGMNRRRVELIRRAYEASALER